MDDRTTKEIIGIAFTLLAAAFVTYLLKDK